MLRSRSTLALRLFSALAILSFVFAGTPQVQAQSGLPPRTNRVLPANLAGLKGERSTINRVINPELAVASGPVRVVVRLGSGPAGLAADQRGQRANVTAEQDAVLARIRQIDPNAKLLGRVKLTLNALMVEIDAAKLETLAADLRVRAINPIVDFELDLSETVPYIGATPAVQAAANAGAGVTVAVLDSGVDYTHAALGGPGTLEAYEAAWGTSESDPRNTTRDGLFPTAKVVAGYDFVGESWPNGALAPDEDPIDLEGHGTHVADIIGGAQGVAPGVSLLAVKVCSAVSSSCSGVALLQGMDFAVDPNGDGNTNDRADVINMSLGSSYGDGFFDDLSTAVENASTIGSLTVASAGNSADRPYIVGTPSAAPSALSVAQTQVPSAQTFPLVINSPAGIAGIYPNTATVDWAPVGAGFTGDVVFVGRGCNGDPELADPAGKVALVDRGACNISEKVANLSAAGAVGVLVGLVAPGDAVTFSNGGQCPVPPDGSCKPTLVITQADANRIKANISAPVNVTVSPATTLPLVGSMVGSSSRGPASGRAFPVDDDYQFGQLIKPEIGAPGASISAIAGTGTGTEAFGGTSGAAPMVAGSAALLIASTAGELPPRELKARLMNTAETEVYTNPATQPGVLAPITRIGGGEVRVDKAIAAGAAAWESGGAGASLSFGFVDVTSAKVRIRRTVKIRNYTNSAITYNIATSFRYADDEANGAVSLKPSVNQIKVAAGAARYFMVTLEIDGTKLRPWTMNSGSGGGNTTALNLLEYDGYVNLTDSSDADNNLHVAWQVLPRKSPKLSVPPVANIKNNDTVTVKATNTGVNDGTLAVFSLIGENSTKPTAGEQGSGLPNITARYLGATTIPVPTSFCASGLVVQFGVQTWVPVTHANYPLSLELYLDNNRDGTPDHVIFTSELGTFASDGRNVVYAGSLSGGAFQAFFFTEHATNSGAFVLTVCGEQVGLASADAGKLVDVTLLTWENYFLGIYTSQIDGTFAVLNERYLATDAAFSTVIGEVNVPAGGNTRFGIANFGTTGTTETGLLLLNTTGATKALVIKAR